MRERKRLTALIVVTLGMVAAWSPPVSSASAEQEGGGGFVRCDPRTCVRAEAREVPGGPVRAARSGRAPFRVRRTYEDCGPNFEQALVLILVETSTNQPLFEISRTCPAPGPGEPRPPGEPPTPQEVWDQLPLWAPSAAAAPACRGVVGLATRLWAHPSAAVPVSVPLNGQTYAVVAEPVGWRIDVTPEETLGRPEPVSVAAPEPGSPDHPLGALAFEQRGTYRVRVTETWTGSYTGPGATYTLDYVEVSRPATTYQVVEIQSVIVGPRTPAAADPTVRLPCGN